MLNYRNGINKGLYKIMSKMGISTIASYRCSKLFEAVGLHDDVVGEAAHENRNKDTDNFLCHGRFMNRLNTHLN